MTSGLCCHCEAKPKQSNFLNNSKYTWLGGRGEAENEKCPVDIFPAERLEQRMFKAGPLAKPGWLSLGLRL
jgi:hypothetical protein